jgi:hypothetical protein
MYANIINFHPFPAHKNGNNFNNWTYKENSDDLMIVGWEELLVTTFLLESVVPSSTFELKVWR